MWFVIQQRRVVTLLLLSSLWGTGSLCKVAAAGNYMDLDYVNFPFRKSEEAAVVEWGHSAVISALEAAVAGFGPQTSRGAFFEVETAVLLADPIDGVVGVGQDKLKNADQCEGNMVVMTNAAFTNKGLTGVDLAKLAQNSGAAALMVVNVEDTQTPDYIYSLQPETPEEQAWADERCDIPVVMVSLTSGNVLTTAQDATINSGMPDRVHLYAGGDRPFFEDVSTEKPMVYLIHHLLTDEECDDLIKAALTTTLETVDYHNQNNPLEGTHLPDNENLGHIEGVERSFLWKGALKGHKAKSIDERLEQVTGFPADHMSDFQINRYGTNGAHHGPHYDTQPSSISTTTTTTNKGSDHKPPPSSSSRPPQAQQQQMATVTIFLNDLPPDAAGDLVFPLADPPVRIRPKKGMAVVHHNLNEEDQLDVDSIHAELPTYRSKTNTNDDNNHKWTAKRWIYTNPVPPSRKIVLPLLALPLGGRLPRFVLRLHQMCVDQWGTQQGESVFDTFVVAAPLVLIAMLVSILTSLLTKTSSSTLTTQKNTKKSKSATKKSKKSSKKKD